ncbi:MAG TPA: hypothetical protein VMW58_05720 [Anaerolineae bacterium]|nr:hypothetical protein [Anaerolineae bacterium]
MRKLKYLIIGLGVVVAVTYAALAILLVNSSLIRVPNAAGFTAKEALAGAQEAARAWQSDAQLVSANASWRGLPPDELMTEEVSWAYTFFSPQAREVRIWSVTPQGATAADTIDASPNTRVLDFAAWEVDSPQVLTAFLDHGGSGFLEENPEATISLRLGPSEDGESPIWLAFGISSSNRSTLTVQVDPVSGEVKTSGS